jgi:hypothetical protein
MHNTLYKPILKKPANKTKGITLANEYNNSINKAFFCFLKIIGMDPNAETIKLIKIQKDCI